MAKQPRTRTRAANLAVPQTAEEAASFVREIGVAAREIARIEHDMNDELTRAKQEAEAAAAPHVAAQKALTEGLRIYCDANRAALTDGGKVKTHEFGTGKVEWRTAPPSVKFSRGVTGEEIVQWLMLEGGEAFADFLRTKTTLDKEAMLADQDKAAKVPGVMIASSGEHFTVTPFEAQIEGGK